MGALSPTPRRRPSTVRRVGLGALALFLAAALVASGQGAPAGGTLRYAEDRAPAIVNPLFATTMSEARLNELAFEGLFTDDLELRSTPALAESFEVASDRRSMTVRLRQGLRWHDGNPITSDDVAFTVAALKDPRTASTEAGRASWIGEVEVIDPHRFTLTFLHEEYAPQDKLHFKILPRSSFRGLPVDRSDPFRLRPIGSGPFTVTTFNQDNSITLQRNTMHPRPPKLEQVVMREVSDKNYQAKLLLYESLDALVRVLPRDLATLQHDKRVELYPYQTNSWWYVGFNHRDARLREPSLRHALSRMVQVPELLAPIGTGQILSGPFVRSSPFYNHEVAPVGHDPDRAADLLSGAGYSFVQGRWLGPDGKPLVVRLATMQDLETAQDVVINLQSQLQRLGITVQPEFVGAAEWKQRIWRDRDFDLVLGQWSFDRNEDITEQFHSTGTRNFVGYASPEVDRLLDEARTASDPQRKKQVLREAHARLAADAPMIFLWTLDSYSAMSVKVKDVVVHPFYFFTWAGDWTMR